MQLLLSKSKSDLVDRFNHEDWHCQLDCMADNPINWIRYICNNVLIKIYLRLIYNMCTLGDSILCSYLILRWKRVGVSLKMCEGYIGLQYFLGTRTRTTVEVWWCGHQLKKIEIFNNLLGMEVVVGWTWGGRGWFILMGDGGTWNLRLHSYWGWGEGRIMADEESSCYSFEISIVSLESVFFLSFLFFLFVSLPTTLVLLCLFLS